MRPHQLICRSTPEGRRTQDLRGSDSDRTIHVVSISKSILPPVDRLRLTVLVEDTVKKPNLIARHGLSFQVETSVAGVDSRILMDTGPPPDVALQNADTIGADIQHVDAIVISHGHYDHTGGLLEILRRARGGIPVVAHPLAINPKFSLNPSLKFIGSNLDQTSVNAAGGILLLVRNPVRVASGVMTTGEVPRETGFEKGETFWTVQGERFVEDPIIDDQAFLINVKDKGLVVITGCAHSGIINTLRLAKKISGISHVCAIVGGFHLARADDNRIQATLDELLSMDPISIHPCHCTGPKATRRFMDSFVGNCRPIQTGDIIAL